MKAAFKSEVLVQELIGVVGKSTTHPPCQKIGLELLEVGMHRSFVLPHMARPRLPPMSRPTGAMKNNGGFFFWKAYLPIENTLNGKRPRNGP
jgi:hypothetical protein